MIRVEFGFDYNIPLRNAKIRLLCALRNSHHSPHCTCLPPSGPPAGVPMTSVVTLTSISSSPVCSLTPTNHTSALFPAPFTSSPRLFRISAALSLSISPALGDSDGKSSMLWPASFGWMRVLYSVAVVSQSAIFHFLGQLARRALLLFFRLGALFPAS